MGSLPWRSDAPKMLRLGGLHQLDWAAAMEILHSSGPADDWDTMGGGGGGDLSNQCTLTGCLYSFDHLISLTPKLDLHHSHVLTSTEISVYHCAIPFECASD